MRHMPGCKYLSDFYLKMMSKGYQIVRNHDVDKYKSPINPYKIIYVDPHKINKMTNRVLPPTKTFGEISDGDWDKWDNLRVNPKSKQWCYELIHGEYFQDTPFYCSMKNHFINNFCWEDTYFYQEILEGIKNGEDPWKWPTNENDLKTWAKETDQLYSKIKNEGYKTQHELSDKKGFFSARREEVSVDIGRDGELLLVDCRHRLAIAQLLNIDVIPVIIFHRHKQWINKREKIYKEYRTKNKLDSTHPDIIEFHHPSQTEYKNNRY